MEKLKTVHSTHTERENNAGIAIYPDIIAFSSNSPGRALQKDINQIKIQKSHHFYDVKNQSQIDRTEYARLLYLMDSDQQITPTNLLPPHRESKKIYPPLIKRNLSEDQTEVLPKTHSIGATIKYSSSNLPPKPGFLWASLLYEDNDYEAATAAFFLTRNDMLHGIFRSNETPQLNRNETRTILDRHTELIQQLIEDGSSEQKARSIALQQLTNEYKMFFFSGQLNRLNLFRSEPQLLDT